MTMMQSFQSSSSSQEDIDTDTVATPLSRVKALFQTEIKREYFNGCLVALTTIGVGVTAYWCYRVVRNIVLDNVKANVLLEVEQRTDDLDQWLIRCKAELATIANTTDMRSMNWPQAEPFLQDEVERISAFYFFAMASPDGSYYNTKVGKAEGKSLSDRRHFQEAMKGNVYVSDPVISKTLDIPIVAMTAPIWGDANQADAPVGVTAGLIDIQEVQEVVSGLQYGPESYAFALNSDGLPIVHPDQSLMSTINDQAPVSFLANDDAALKEIATRMVNQEQGLQRTVLGGEPVYVAYQPLAEANWSLALVIPRNNIESQLQLLNVMALLVLGLVIALLFVLWRVQKIKQIQLQASKELSDAANQAKSEFLANMSHELRTPLNGILGYAQILMRSQDLNGQAQQGLKTIYQCGSHLLTLINDILDLAKIEARKLTLVPSDFHFNALLDSVIEICQIQAEQKGIAFQYHLADCLPVGIVTDQKRLRQVLLNLLSNAIKFTEQGQVTLSISGGVILPASVDYQLNVRVEDTGIGLSPEQCRQIFDPFEQVGHHAKRSEGTGLGLAISQRIINHLGGEITVESELGKGSAFSFSIAVPISKEWLQTAACQEQGQIMGYEGPKRQILIVDDRWENLSFLNQLLTSIGFDVTEACHGQDALDKMAQLHPDAVITDLIMPVMDGFSLIQKLRQSEKWRDLIIIASSASVTAMDEQKSLQVGSHEFLPKPIQVKQLFDFLKKHLQLTWTYKTSTTITVSSEKSTPDLTYPPIDVLEMLYNLALQGDLNNIKQHSIQLQTSEPAYRPFVEKIQQFTNTFQEQKLAEFLQQSVTDMRQL